MNPVRLKQGGIIFQHLGASRLPGSMHKSLDPRVAGSPERPFILDKLQSGQSIHGLRILSPQSTVALIGMFYFDGK